MARNSDGVTALALCNEKLGEQKTLKEKMKDKEEEQAGKDKEEEEKKKSSSSSSSSSSQEGEDLQQQQQQQHHHQEEKENKGEGTPRGRLKGLPNKNDLEFFPSTGKETEKGRDRDRERKPTAANYYAHLPKIMVFVGVILVLVVALVRDIFTLFVDSDEQIGTVRKE